MSDPLSIQDQLDAIHKAVSPFLTDAVRSAYWKQRWEVEALHAARAAEISRFWFYCLRGIAVGLTIIVPALVGLNLAGTGGEAVRWTTLSLSAAAAVLTAFLTLFRLEDRWLMYRNLQFSLFGAGWGFANSDHSPEPWEAFTAATEKALVRYNGEYASEIIAGAQQANKSEPTK